MEVLPIHTEIKLGSRSKAQLIFAHGFGGGGNMGGGAACATLSPKKKKTNFVS